MPKASLSLTEMNSSIMLMSSVSGTQSCPTPSTLYGEPVGCPSPLLRHSSASTDPIGSAAMILMFGFLLLR